MSAGLIPARLAAAFAFHPASVSLIGPLMGLGCRIGSSPAGVLPSFHPLTVVSPGRGTLWAT
jgi:hypothetical protein